MHKYFIFFVIFSMLWTSYVPAASAVSDEDFNPNYILSDEELQDSNAMSYTDIVGFLESKNSTLAKYQADDKHGVTRPAAQIIYNAAQEHQINPKYLLVKLQKEQSLISDPTPSQKQLDWATGYAVCDSCKTTDPSIQKNKGFGKQVDSAAGIMRWYYENTASKAWIHKPYQTYIISGQQVTPATNATAFLYTYTPHIHGNKNFWKLWERWFEQVYPDGTLLKDATGPNIYLVGNGKKRRITNMTALVTRFDPNLIVEVPPSELSRYAEGVAISFPNYSILFDGSTYYLLDNEYLRPFASSDVLKKLGYHPDEIIEVQKSDLKDYPLSQEITANIDPVGKLVVLKETGGKYFIKDGIFRPVPSPEVAQSHLGEVVEEQWTIADLTGLTEGPSLTFKNGTLFKIDGYNRVYVVENGKKRHIPNEEVFLGLGYKWDNIITANVVTATLHPDGMPMFLRAEDPEEEVFDDEPLTAPSTPMVPTLEPVTAPSDGTLIFEETGNMYVTPASEKEVTGSNFNTDIESYLVAEYDSGSILAGKNINSPRPLASLTKVMSAHAMLEADLPLFQSTRYLPTKHKALYHRFKVAQGDLVRNRDLLYSMLVTSLNTPTIMLAENVGGVDTVVTKMNQQAKDWGLKNTNFTDTSGIDLGNYGTAKEYHSLFARSLQNSELKRILGLKDYVYYEMESADDIKIHKDNHSNDLVFAQDTWFNVHESKTGYLYESGFNLAMVVSNKFTGKKYIIVMLGVPDYYNRFEKAKQLTNWAVQL